MCGIFGCLIRENHGFKRKFVVSSLKELFRLSESRGKESAGLAIVDKKGISVIKSNISGRKLISSNEFKTFMKENYKTNIPNENAVCYIGHTRLVTDGSDEIHYNNQPVIIKEGVGIHNGIIVNSDKLWKKYDEMNQEFQIDTEILFKMIMNFYKKEETLPDSVKKAFCNIQGNASIGYVFRDLDYLLLATNNGSLYLMEDETNRFVIFASELYILNRMKLRFSRELDKSKTYHLEPGNAKLFHLYNNKVIEFNLDADINTKQKIRIDQRKISRSIIDIPLKSKEKTSYIETNLDQDRIELLFEDKEKLKNIKRCTKCLLPFTFPYIEFDINGECNYCKNYKKLFYKGEEELLKYVKKYRSKDGKPDCLIMFSGGRDSSYAVHYVKNILKMNPITYTYDWGMVTDLARRNISRLCGALGLEHILVSADISKKRKFISKNILAWLKRPELGMVPIFMAGDKQWYAYANKVKKQLGVELVFLATNDLEDTHFKVGFCGISGEMKYRKISKKLKLLKYYINNYIKNPKYFNSSLFDTISAFRSFYFIEHDYLKIFKYIPWREDKVVSTLINNYDWETATDTKSTWRIGDGTAAFYNYIYYTVAGFTESDTFRSNQIREGLLTRDEAKEIIEEENRPRYESIKCYLGVIGLQNKFNEVIQKINAIHKLWEDNKK